MISLKKISIFLSAFILVLSLTACGTKTPISPKSSESSTQNSVPQSNVTPNNAIPNTTVPSNVIPDKSIPNDAPPITAKDISYLPSYNKMELQSISQPDQNQLITSRYLIKNTSIDKALNEYADILKKDGWTVSYSYTQDKMPYGLTAQKDKHTAVFITQPKGSDVLFIIGSK